MSSSSSSSPLLMTASNAPPKSSERGQRSVLSGIFHRTMLRGKGCGGGDRARAPLPSFYLLSRYYSYRTNSMVLERERGRYHITTYVERRHDPKLLSRAARPKYYYQWRWPPHSYPSFYWRQPLPLTWRQPLPSFLRHHVSLLPKESSQRRSCRRCLLITPAMVGATS